MNSEKEMSNKDFEMMLKEFIDKEYSRVSTEMKADHQAIESLMVKERNRKRGRLRDLTSVSVDVLPMLTGKPYVKGPVAISLGCSEDMCLRPEDFSFFVYREDYFPMCKSRNESKRRRETAWTLTVTVESERVWMPGDHVLYVCDEKDRALGRLDFTLDERLSVSNSTWHLCEPGSKGLVLTTLVEKHGVDWENLALFPGAGELRRYVVDDWQLEFFNEFRSMNTLPSVGACRHLVITSQHEELTEKLMGYLKIMSAEDTFTFQYVDCSKLYDVTDPNPYHETCNTLLYDRCIYCLNHLEALNATGGKVIVKKFLQKVKEFDRDVYLWLCGTPQEVATLFEQYPSLRELFAQHRQLALLPAKPHELMQAFMALLEDEGLTPGDEAVDRLARAFIKSCEQGVGDSLTRSRMRRMIEEHIKPRYLERAYGEMQHGVMAQLEPEDIDFNRLTDRTTTFEECIRELNGMVGLDDIKQGITTMARNTRFYVERRRRGLPTSADIAYHCIFTGNPGTGNTTVARMLGRIYHSLGLLSRGEVIAVDRTRLVGRYIGETEENMKMVLEEARGNVLFIDEAYTLYDGSGDRKDFGGRVIDALLTVLSQPNPDLLVVFAGYEKEMNAMLSTNPGLFGRFPYKYKFSDYTAPQLMEIACRLLSRDEYVLTPEAATLLQESIGRMVEQRTPNFSNARWVEQLVRNGIIPAMADRLTLTGADDYQHIEPADIECGYEKFNPKTIELRPHRKMGFTA